MNEPMNNRARALIACWVAGIVLVFLRAFDLIQWNWIWVLAPFWGPFALVLALLTFAAITMALARFFGWIARNL